MVVWGKFVHLKGFVEVRVMGLIKRLVELSLGR
jgi:hypothetical protein